MVNSVANKARPYRQQTDNRVNTEGVPSLGRSKKLTLLTLSSSVLLLSACASGSSASDSPSSAGLTPVRFSEAVHNLGYINLYVAMDKGFFKDHGIDLSVSAAGGDTQAFAAVLGKSADFAIGDSTLAEISRENGGPGIVLGEVVSRAHSTSASPRRAAPQSPIRLTSRA
jgi:NitT/TauT family transport system substrate-binding protein